MYSLKIEWELVPIERNSHLRSGRKKGRDNGSRGEEFQKRVWPLWNNKKIKDRTLLESGSPLFELRIEAVFSDTIE